MLGRILGVLIIGCAGFLAYKIINENDGLPLERKVAACKQLTPAEYLVNHIKTDFDQLARDGQLPAEWNQIGPIRVHMGSSLAKTLLGKAKLQFPRIQDGSSLLELEILDLPDDENPGIIIQASLFDVKSNNKIFEVGRTYTMKEINNEQEVQAAPSEEKKTTTQEK